MLTFDSEAAASARADEIHAWMIANKPTYAASVDAGQTVRWAIPTQEEAGAWLLPVDQRCLGALSTDERHALAIDDNEE